LGCLADIMKQKLPGREKMRQIAVLFSGRLFEFTVEEKQFQGAHQKSKLSFCTDKFSI